MKLFPRFWRETLPFFQGPIYLVSDIMYFIFWMFCFLKAHTILRSFLLIQVIFCHLLFWINPPVTSLFSNSLYLYVVLPAPAFITALNLMEGSLKTWDKWSANIPATSMCWISLDLADVDSSNLPFQRKVWSHYKGAEARRSKQGYTVHHNTWWSWFVFSD